MNKLSKSTTTKRAPRTLKERKFAKAYIESGSATNAALVAYDTIDRNVAASIGSENLGKLDFSGYFSKAGLSDEVMAREITAIATSATKFAFTGKVYKEAPDYASRLQAMKLAVEIMGRMPRVGSNVGAAGEMVITVQRFYRPGTEGEKIK